MVTDKTASDVGKVVIYGVVGLVALVGILFLWDFMGGFINGFLRIFLEKQDGPILGMESLASVGFFLLAMGKCSIIGSLLGFLSSFVNVIFEGVIKKWIKPDLTAKEFRGFVGQKAVLGPTLIIAGMILIIIS